MHQTAVSTGDRTNGADLGIREDWLPLFDKFGVDLVVCGHEHHYERSHPIRGVLPTDTLTPATVDTHTTQIDTSKGTVHLVIGGGGTSIPSNKMFFPQPRCRVLMGVGGVDPATGQRIPRYIEEPAAWSAFRDPINPYGFVAFDVDPGKPGGTTTMAATYYALHGPFGEVVPVDQVHPDPAPARRLTGNSDGSLLMASLSRDLGQHHSGRHRSVQRLGRPGHRDGHHGVAVLAHQP